MPLPFGSLLNPAADQIDLTRGQRRSRFGGRHSFGKFRGRYAPVQFALSGIARFDDLTPFAVDKNAHFVIKAQVRLALGLVRAVTLKASIREYRTDVAVELDFVWTRRGGGGRHRRHGRENQRQRQGRKYASHFRNQDGPLFQRRVVSCLDEQRFYSILDRQRASRLVFRGLARLGPSRVCSEFVE